MRLLALLVLLTTSTRGFPRCFDDPGDAQKVADARAQAEAACEQQNLGCTSAPSHGRYVACVAKQTTLAAQEGRLAVQCKAAVKRCAAHSTCGRAGFVTCCRTGPTGLPRCKTASSARRCVDAGGQVGGCPSCCDACTPGGCPTTTTTSVPVGTTMTRQSSTTTSTSTTATSSTSFPTATTMPPCTTAGQSCGHCGTGQCEAAALEPPGSGCALMCTSPPDPTSGCTYTSQCPPNHVCTYLQGCTVPFTGGQCAPICE